MLFSVKFSYNRRDNSATILEETETGKHKNFFF